MYEGRWELSAVSSSSQASLPRLSLSLSSLTQVAWCLSWAMTRLLRKKLTSSTMSQATALVSRMPLLRQRNSANMWPRWALVSPSASPTKQRFYHTHTTCALSTTHLPNFRVHMARIQHHGSLCKHDQCVRSTTPRRNSQANHCGQMSQASSPTTT